MIMLLSYGNNALSYTFYITNFTGQDVKVRLYWLWGEITEKAELIKEFDTHRLFFGKWKIGLCLTSIKVLTKESGTWISRPVQIQFVSNKQFKELGKADFLGYIFTEGLKLWELTGCGNKDFILIDDPESGKILAITTTTL